MALSLDHYTAMPWHYPTPSSPSPSPQSSHASIPVLDSDAEIHAHLHNTRSPPRARNRWFDKSLTLSLERNTRAGAMGEHAPVDALVPSVVFDYAVVAGTDSSAFLEPEPLPLTLKAAHVRDVGEGWTRLDFVTDERIKAQINEAEGRAQVLIDNSDSGVLEFGEYGSDWMGSVGKFVIRCRLSGILTLLRVLRCGEHLNLTCSRSSSFYFLSCIFPSSFNTVH